MISFLQKLSLKDRVAIIFSLLTNVIILASFIFLPADLEAYAAWGYLGVFVANLLASAVLFSPIPAYLISFVAYLNGLSAVGVIIVSVIATTIGEIVPYILGEGVDDFVKDRKWHQALKKWFLKFPFLFLVIWVVLPNPIQPLGQIFAGTTNYPWWKYTLAIGLANAIWFTLVIAVGHYFFL